MNQSAMSSTPITSKEAARINEIKRTIKDVKQIIELVKTNRGYQLIKNGAGKELKPLAAIFDRGITQNTFYTNMVRKFLLDSYLNKKALLTRKDVVNFIQNTIHIKRSLTDILMSKHGLVFQNVNGNIIAREDPEQVFQRTDYLKKIMSLRAKQNAIVYIGTFNLESPRMFPKFCKDVRIIVSPKYGHIDIRPKDFEIRWIVEVMTKVPEKVTFIIDEGVGSDEEVPPGINSSREWMESWLNIQCVPFDKNMHRSEMYKLIGLKQKAMMNKSELMAKAVGSDVVLRKRNISLPNYFEKFSEIIKEPKWEPSIIHAIEAIKSSYASIDDTYSLLNSLPLQIWKDVEESVILEEQKILEEDMMMETNLDELLKGTNPKNCRGDHEYFFCQLRV